MSYSYPDELPQSCYRKWDEMNAEIDRLEFLVSQEFARLQREGVDMAIAGAKFCATCKEFRHPGHTCRDLRAEVKQLKEENAKLREDLRRAIRGLPR